MTSKGKRDLKRPTRQVEFCAGFEYRTSTIIPNLVSFWKSKNSKPAIGQPKFENPPWFGVTS
jgi:hypothetical protein